MPLLSFFSVVYHIILVIIFILDRPHPPTCGLKCEPMTAGVFVLNPKSLQCCKIHSLLSGWVRNPKFLPKPPKMGYTHSFPRSCFLASQELIFSLFFTSTPISLQTYAKTYILAHNRYILAYISKGGQQKSSRAGQVDTVYEGRNNIHITGAKLTEGALTRTPWFGVLQGPECLYTCLFPSRSCCGTITSVMQ